MKYKRLWLSGLLLGPWIRIGRPRGQANYPDAMTWAKRAQVGFVNSRFEDPEPTSAHVASMVRGLAHYKSIGDGEHAQWVEAYVKTRLEALPDRYPQLVQGTRQRGCFYI